MRILFFILLTLNTIAAQAWKEVGNAAGLSEQNIVYAKENASEILSPLWSSGVESDLAGFAAHLERLVLEFDSGENPRAFEVVSAYRWKIHPRNLSTEDHDGDGNLNLKEVFLFLLKIYHQVSPVPEEVARASAQRLFEFLSEQETSLFLQSGPHRLQWSQHRGARESRYLLFYPDVNALEIRPTDFVGLCQSDFTDLKLSNPFIKSTSKSGTGFFFILGAKATFQCAGQGQTKSILIKIHVAPDRDQMSFDSYGVLN